MTQEALAPVRWEMGQPLLPEHLLAQEESLLAEASLRFQIQGFPSFGLCRLAWDAALLNEGVLKITNLRLLVQGYTRLVDYPSNATIVSPPLELEGFHNPQVQYCVFEERSSKNPTIDSYYSKHAETISRRLLKIVFFCNLNLPGEYEALLKDHMLVCQGSLGIFEKTDQGDWRLTDRVIPPLLQIGASPYLRRPLKQLLILLRRFRTSLTQKYGSQNIPKPHLHDVKLCLNSLQSSLRLLENLDFWDVAQGELQLHPYFIYESLQRLLNDIKLYRGEWPEREPLVYKHNQLHNIFKQLFQRLLPRLKTDKKRAQSLELILQDGIYSNTLPNESRYNDSLYLVVSGGGRSRLDHSDLPKISSKQRLRVLNDYSLQGLELIPVKQPSLGYDFGTNFQCFKLGQGTEWQFIHRDNSIAFYAQLAFRHFDFYLYRKSKPNFGFQ